MNDLAINPERILTEANHRLARLLEIDALPLATGGHAATQDRLWIWGVLGGKNVGKSTLINALAGAPIVEKCGYGQEGTRRPAAYLAAGAESSLQSRLQSMGIHDLDIRASAPDDLAGLVLVDLPDFDSTFTSHVDVVHRLVPALDGVIWVATHKKLGDLRTIREIRAVLKDRANFVYVVNKADALLAQSDGDPAADLERARSALKAQIAADHATPADIGSARTFLVSALCGRTEELLAAIARARGEEAAQLSISPAWSQAVNTIAADMLALRRTLLTPPDKTESSARKRGNLDYQLSRQAADLTAYYNLSDRCNRLERAESDVAGIVAREFPLAELAQMFERMTDTDRLAREWSGALFRHRIAAWPLLGMIAGPINALGSAIGSLRGWLGTTDRNAAPHDPLRVRRRAPEDRAAAALSELRNRLPRTPRTDLPDERELAQSFRDDAAELTATMREAAIGPRLARRPTRIGCWLRGLVTVSILLWFPLVQPPLAALLTGAAGDLRFDLKSAALLARTLSAGTVLVGLAAAIFILALLTAWLYSRCVRHAARAADQLAGSATRAAAHELSAAITSALQKPIARVRRLLTEVATKIGTVTYFIDIPSAIQ